MKIWLILTAILFTSACASGGRYGYARTYIPTGDEEDAAEDAAAYDPVMAQRRQHEWIGKKISIFGVVESVQPWTKGGNDVLLSIRRLQDRNLCLTHDDDTCRVTVTDHSFGMIHAIVSFPGEEPGPRSLLRVIGTISENTHPKTGNWVLEVEFHRHWPGGEFVTLSQREFMRQ